MRSRTTISARSGMTSQAMFRTTCSDMSSTTRRAILSICSSERSDFPAGAVSDFDEEDTATSGVFLGVAEGSKPAGEEDEDPLLDAEGDEPNPDGEGDDPNPAGGGLDPNPEDGGAELKIDSDCELSGSGSSSPNGLSSVFILGGAGALKLEESQSG